MTLLSSVFPALDCFRVVNSVGYQAGAGAPRQYLGIAVLAPVTGMVSARFKCSVSLKTSSPVSLRGFARVHLRLARVSLLLCTLRPYQAPAPLERHGMAEESTLLCLSVPFA